MTNNVDRSDYVLGAGVGYGTYKGVQKYGKKFKSEYAKQIMADIQNFSQSESSALRKATYNTFALSGLESKGCALHDVKPPHVKVMTDLIAEKSNARLMNSKWGRKIVSCRRKPLSPEETLELSKKLSELLKNGQYKDAWKEFKKALNRPQGASAGRIIESDKKISKALEAVAKGENAFYHPISKDIMVNVDKLGAASFHEMGHALNASGSKLLKILSYGRHVTKLFVPVILAVGLLKSNKEAGQEPNGIIDKTTTFIKNNVGKLTFAAIVPTLAEEGLASIRGGQLAKKVLRPDLVKCVNKGHFMAWTTYLIGALITTGAVKLATTVRDKIADNKNN